MDRILLVDSACSRYNGLATEIKQASDGLLDVRSLHDAHMHDLLDRARPAWRQEPTLIEVEGDSVRVFTGLALRSRLIAVLGLRRALRVAELVARSQTDVFTDSGSRRTLLRRGASIAAGVAGLALLGPTPRTIPVAAADRDKDKDKDKGKKPGKYSRKEGIEEWKVDKTPDGYKVKFEHEKKKLSGRVNITIGGHSADVTLSRDGETLSIATNANAETFAVVDANGRAMSASWNENRREWTMTAQGERILEENQRDIDLAIAVTSDLWRPSFSASRLSSASVETDSVEAMAQQGCAKEDRRWGRSGVWPLNRSEACEIAEEEANNLCNKVSHCQSGCCSLNTCDCGCGIGDFVCWCEQSGDPPAKRC